MTHPYDTRIIDVRPEGHQSLSVIPRFRPEEFERLQHHWKFEILYAHGYDRAAPGEVFWAIDAIEVKAGPATIQPQVRDFDGELYYIPPGILMALYWPGAPIINFSLDPKYFDRAAVGFTEGNGSIGWGFGGSSWINAAEPNTHEGGPYSCWASADPEPEPGQSPHPDRVVGSDCLSKIGWWDDHIVLNMIAKKTRKAGPVTPPPIGGAAKMIIKNEDGSIYGHIPIQDGAGPEGIKKQVLEIGGVEMGYIPIIES